jgi:hypothetical protein
VKLAVREDFDWIETALKATRRHNGKKDTPESEHAMLDSLSSATTYDVM